MNFRSEEVRRNPFPAYSRIRSASPVVHDAASDAWMIFDYDGVKRAISDHGAFSSSMAVAGRRNPDWFIFFDAPRHTKQRSLVMRAFTPRVIAGLEQRIRELSRDLLRQAASRDEMDLATEYSTPLPMIVIAEMLGIPAADWPRFKEWGDVILRLSYTLSADGEALKAAAAYGVITAEMAAYVGELIEQRRAAPKDDLLTRLVEAEADGEHLSKAEILGFFQLLLVAGTETTTNLINNGILCLLENPDQLVRLRANPALFVSAIEEVLRYRSPVQWMFRATRADVEMHGEVIPAGKLVLPMIGSANRDERHFENPDRFDIARDPNPHIAFGHGPHFCLGAPLSRLEARIALTDLLEGWKEIELASREPWEPRKALHVHGPASMPIRFQPDGWLLS